MNSEDLSSLTLTDVDSLISQLSSRYDRGQFYTKVGSDVLIAVSPTSEFNAQDSTKYASNAEIRWMSPSSADSPSYANILDLTSMAFFRMLHAQEDQSILLR